jgi:REP element-mobilizing transposase RayT
MPRKPREEEAGAVHHVFARHNEQRLLYRDDVDRRRYLKLLADSVGRFGWRCMAYCLMPNHMHLLIETPRPNLGRGMQYLHGHYGRWFADRRGVAGHVFQGRYGAKRVTDDEQLWAVAAYLAANPVDAGLCASPEEWAWGSHRAITGRVAVPVWLDVARLLELLGAGESRGARRRYLTYVDERPPKADTR